MLNEISLIQEIKARIESALRTGNAIEKDTLKILLGDIQTEETRRNKTFSDEEIHSMAAKICTQLEETVNVGKLHNYDVSKFEKQIEILSCYKPKFANFIEVKSHVLEDLDLKNTVKNAKSEGQAIGTIVKFLKAKGINASIDDIKKIIMEIKS